MAYCIFQEVPEFTSKFTSLNILESRPLQGLRVGIIRETLGDGVDENVVSSIRAAASHLEDLGCSVTEVGSILFYMSADLAILAGWMNSK